MRLAVVGITGLVGQNIANVLNDRNIAISEFFPMASPSSIGKDITFRGEHFKILSTEDLPRLNADVAIFSAGGSTSLKIAPFFKKHGVRVIDNSSAWRMDPEVPLIIPEINPEALDEKDYIIANPNCSTIQMLMALAPLHKRYGLKRLVVSTYQSYTGTGMKAVRQYEGEKRGVPITDPAYPHPIFENCIPHCDIFLENGYTKEEMKLVHESQKILDDSSIHISATAVRVPVNGGHSESINAEFNEAPDLTEVRHLVENSAGLVLIDDPETNMYPTPLAAKGRDEVFVGRLRKDPFCPTALNLWVVADNLRKGAATNAIQIMELLKERCYI